MKRRNLLAAVGAASVTGLAPAVLRAQAVAVPINPASTPTEIAAMVVDSGARVAVTMILSPSEATACAASSASAGDDAASTASETE